MMGPSLYWYSQQSNRKHFIFQLSSYLVGEKFIFDNQYGFRPQHSTEYAALELLDSIMDKMDKNDTTIKKNCVLTTQCY